MSKIIYACFRNREISPEIVNKVNTICNALNPDNIAARENLLEISQNIIYGIANPSAAIQRNGENVLLGHTLSGAEGNWQQLGEEAPDGNFAIFRTTENELEIISDVMETKTIWYYFDKEIFLASSSQKAIIQFLGSFEFEERLIPWMISTGSLGPSFAWDRRIKRVPTDGYIKLNRKSWELTQGGKPVVFSKSKKSHSEYKKLLASTLQETFKKIQIDLRKWVITLSGGHDSRAILLLFKEFNSSPKKEFRTITWGEKKSLQDPHSDASIAEKLSKKENTDHQYYFTENADEPTEKIVERFLNNGEGRIDHITGYMDGFKIWQKIYQDKILGVIRGDEVFGYNKIYSPLIVNSFMGLTLCSDYSNLKKYKYISTLPQQKPEVLERKKDESLSTWRDRIFQIYRIPFVQSALADLKYPYVEQVNPFLSRKVVMATRQLPDHLRTDKKLFKEVMRERDTGVPFSKRDSNALLRDVLKEEDFVALIKTELSSYYAKKLFPSDFLEQVISNLKIQENNTPSTQKGFMGKLKSFIPKKLKKYLAQQQKSLILDENILGFRIFIICKMHRMFSSFNKAS